MSKAANKNNRKLKTNVRGMMNVQGIDIEDDETNNNGFEIRGSEYKGKKKKKKCC